MDVSRRGFLAGSLATGALAATPHPVIAAASPGVPPAASKYGMTLPTFVCDFTDEQPGSAPQRVDVAGTGARRNAAGQSHHLFARAPYWAPTCSASSFSLRDDGDGTGTYLHVAPDVANGNRSLSSLDARTGSGVSFQYGYFEARIRFEPRERVTTYTPASWPSFWGMSRVDVRPGQRWSRCGEIDFFEALEGDSTYLGVVHEWRWEGSPHFMSAGGAMRMPGRFGGGWHTVAGLWLPPIGTVRGRVCWYLDDVYLGQVMWDAEAGPYPEQVWQDANGTRSLVYPPRNTFTMFDAERMVLCVGSGPSWPMDLRWIRVWQWNWNGIYYGDDDAPLGRPLDA